MCWAGLGYWYITILTLQSALLEDSAPHTATYPHSWLVRSFSLKRETYKVVTRHCLLDLLYHSVRDGLEIGNKSLTNKIKIQQVVLNAFSK